MSVGAQGSDRAGEETRSRTHVFIPPGHVELPSVSAPHLAAEMARGPLADFELLDELGEGAQGRVFLARQASLADRVVVLKVTPCHGREHLSLARLQHTHIVSLFWAHDDRAHNRRTLCMPYFGDVTLAGLLAALKAQAPAQRTGQDIVDVLDRAVRASPAPLPARGPARQALARASYPQALAWIGACLADALQYAHERGLLHLDLKPSNVLLAADGQPMLLDFHLAQEPMRAGVRTPGLGGTPLYMSPEQRAAALASSGGKPAPAAVDGRSDVYSLGLTLYQALGGSVPLQYPPPRLDRCNPRVSVGLADVIHKCLAEKPGDRYPDAGALAADLRRHVAGLPLRGVRNRSWAERWRKWRRRRPQGLAVLGMVAAVVATVVLVGAGYLRGRQEQFRERLGRAEQALTEGQESLREGKYAVAVERLKRGLEVAATMAGAEELAQRLDQQLRQAWRLDSADRLRRLAEAIRFESVADGMADEELRKLENSCRALWAKRERVLSFHRGEEGDEIAARVRTDLLDLAMCWIDLRLRLARGADLDAERHQSLQVLTEAEKLFGPNPVLLWERRTLAGVLGREEPARAALAARLPRTAWECYALGRRLLRTGDLERAAVAFEDAVGRDAAGFWPNFYRGVRAHRRGRHADAVAAFSVCIGVAPTSAPAYYNRALALAGLEEFDQAVRDYGHALQLDPNLAEAAFNRALLHHRQGRPALAQADVHQALAARPAYPEALALEAELRKK